MFLMKFFSFLVKLSLASSSTLTYYYLVDFLSQIKDVSPFYSILGSPNKYISLELFLLNTKSSPILDKKIFEPLLLLYSLV